MARPFNGSSDCAAASLDLSAVNKLMLAFWLYWDAFANDDDFAFEFTADFGANAGGFVVCPNFSSGTFAVALNGNAGQCFATFSRPSAAAWHQYVALLDMSKASSKVDSVYVDGVSQSLGYSQNNNNSGNFANSTLNFMSRNGASHFGAGRLAEIGLWPGVLPMAGSLSYSVTKAVGGTLPLAGTLIKNVAKDFTGLLSFAGLLRAGLRESPCALTVAEMRARLYERLDDDGTYYTPTEVLVALNAAQDVFAYITLCIERTASFTLTGG